MFVFLTLACTSESPWNSSVDICAWTNFDTEANEPHRAEGELVEFGAAADALPPTSERTAPARWGAQCWDGDFDLGIEVRSGPHTSWWIGLAGPGIDLENWALEPEDQSVEFEVIERWLGPSGTLHGFALWDEDGLLVSAANDLEAAPTIDGLTVSSGAKTGHRGRTECISWAETELEVQSDDTTTAAPGEDGEFTVDGMPFLFHVAVSFEVEEYRCTDNQARHQQWIINRAR